MKERLLSVLCVLLVALNTVAEIPQGYYDKAIGKSGKTLQTTLSEIIKHSDPGYDNLWAIYETTDRRPDGTVWDMYSNTSKFKFGSDKCGSYSGEGDCYNREHSIPKSWRGGSKYSDAHIVVPTDGYVNNRRSNYPFGEVGSSSYVSDNSFSKLGACKTSGYSGTVFEPNDEYKGDFARIYFYAATRYYSECGSWSGDGFSGTFPYLDEWVRVMMLRWHELDPVSPKEIERNDAVYASRQGNRNPFVDYPELVELIFGSSTTTAFNPGNAPQIPVLESPVDGEAIDMGVVSMGAEGNTSTSKTICIKGRNITDALTLSVAGSAYFQVNTTTISANDANNGKNVVITYTPDKSGTHTATLTIAGGGVSKSVVVALSGYATESFVAVNASNIGSDYFQANWSRHTHATDYELAVWYYDGGSAQTQTLFDVDFADGVPSGWSTTGYTAKESGAVRLASGNNDGIVITPAIDLSSASNLTVKCKPYKTSDNSVLYILVDGKEVAQIDCADGEVVEDVVLDAATSLSTISFKASKSHRVYLQSATLTTGGAEQILVDGYPRRVGNVLNYLVQGLDADYDYYYNVTAYNGTTKLEESNTVFVSVASSLDAVLTQVPQGVYVYSYGSDIYIDDAPANARVYCYSLDGRLCDTRTIHATRETLSIQRPGIYVVQIVCEQGCYATRVAVY